MASPAPIAPVVVVLVRTENVGAAVDPDVLKLLELDDVVLVEFEYPTSVLTSSTVTLEELLKLFDHEENDALVDPLSLLEPVFDSLYELDPEDAASEVEPLNPAVRLDSTVELLEK